MKYFTHLLKIASRSTAGTRVRQALSVLGLNALLALSVSGQNPWQDVSPNADWTFPDHSQLSDYRALALDLPVFEQQMTNPPTGGRTVVLLPRPDQQGFDSCTVYEDPVLPPGLAQKYPTIKTYSGYLNRDPSVLVRIDLGPRGMHAMVFGNGEHWFVDPALEGGASYYASYDKSSAKPYYNFTCHLTGPIEFPSSSKSLHRKTSIIAPEGLHTYRLAVSTTGEYGNFHGGSIPAILSAIVTTVHRVNGIYARDLSIKFILAEKNDTLLFSDPVTDPFTNFDPFALVVENQVLIDSLLGDTAYDIGHNFGTGSGGYAPGLTCTAGSKAGGVTGGPTPVGDAFDVDYVAHEIGHQFGANHTQNNPCNRVASSAYEPGSASTIMGYAGICPPNLQTYSDAYFHIHSIGEIKQYISNGPGAFCVPLDTNANTAPSVSVPSSGFYIPHSTPFKLEGSATDLQGDALSYCWEQFNLGPAGAPSNPSGNAPIFRSLLPVSNPERVFPRMPSLLGSPAVVGEQLPEYTRSMRFRLVVRDNALPAGAVSFGQVDFSVDGQSGPFKVIQPNSQNKVSCQYTYPIQWSVNGTDQLPVSCQLVSIYFSSDNGGTFSDTLAFQAPNSGQWDWFVPAGYETTQGRILIEAAGNHFFAVSDVFEIETGSIGVEDPYRLNQTIHAYPNPAKSGREIRVLGLSGETVQWHLSDILGRPLANGTWRANEPRIVSLPSRFAGQAVLSIEGASGAHSRAKVLILPE